MPRRLVSFDYAMKNLLRDKANYGILEGFLTALLNEDITVCTILESESNTDNRFEKFNRVDILAKDSKERQFIIEIQFAQELDYLERSIWGACKAVCESISGGEAYGNITKVIAVNLVYFPLLSIDGYLFRGRTVIEDMTNNKIIELPTYHHNEKIASKSFVHPDKFPEFYFINISGFQDKINLPVDEWIYMFKNDDILDSFSTKNIQLASERLNRLKLSKEEQAAYDKLIDNRMSIDNAMQLKYTTGKAEGEDNKAIEVAKKSLALGSDISFVAAITGLSIRRIKEIQKNL